MNLNNIDFSYGFKGPGYPILLVMGITAMILLGMPGKSYQHSIDINPWKIPSCNDVPYGPCMERTK